ncbi:MAG: hypothetical protein ACREPZ_07045 [Rhodanobacteraceae bacterium]
MPDHLIPRLQRIALVFGDEAAAAHVREAVQGRVDIAYATAAACFDASRMAEANVEAALVNLDDGGWLDAVAAELDAAGVPLVYNDSGISRGLEGWARARWLRHLLAKLRGSTDVDPPRPEQAAPRGGVPFVGLEDSQVPPHQTGVFERPLSPQEIETMTADFVQETAGAQAGDGARRAAADAPTVASGAMPDADAGPSQPVEEPGVDDLEVDTETLSAMIDARLSDAQSRSPSDSPEVWRVVEGGTASPATPTAGAESESGVAVAGHASAAPVAAAGGSAEEPEASPLSLLSLDDWQLVDTDDAPAPAPQREHKKNPEPELPASLAALQLEPMETASAVVHTEPIERWLHESEPRKSAARAENAEEAESVGDKA